MGQPATLKDAQNHDASHNHWKIIGRVLAFSVLTSILLTVLFYLQKNQQQQQFLQQSHMQDVQLIETLTTNSGEKLQKLFSVITALDGIKDALEEKNHDLLQQAIDQHANYMQYQWNLDYVGLFSPDGQSLATWSSYPTQHDLKTMIDGYVTAAIENQNEIKLISCVQTCSQYLIAPLISEQSNPAIMVVSISLLDILNQFHQASSKAIGLLTPPQAKSTVNDKLKTRWGLSLYSVTDAASNEPILQQFTTGFVPKKGLVQHVEQEYQQQSYQLSLHPVSSMDDSFLFILQDISAISNTLRDKTLQFALLSFSGLLILLLLLHILLRGLLQQRKIRTTVISADKQLVEDATDIEITTAEDIYTDANTPLDFDLTSIDEMSITDRLDQLRKYNQHINKELARQMLILGQERDQIRKILDNTQTIILTLHKDGRIASINRFGESITGYSKDEIIDKNFIDLYPEQVPYALNDLHTMAAIAEGIQESYRHEARLSCKDGKERSILWLHSSLTNDESTQLLSTGLDITESKQLEKNLSWLADHDSLTALHNRRRFEKELEDALNWANAHQAHGALLYIDLDNFKDINDSCGHQVGDVILRKVASTLTTLTKDIDQSAHLICARLGGDEFAILLRNIDQDGASILSDRILSKLYQIRHDEENFQFQLSCSIGIAPFPGVENSANELLSNADFAMYQAKILGRNQHYLFKEDDSHREKINHRLIWREKIENALNNGRFVLHYQPILNIQQRTISHYETLIRMLDEDDKLISPGVFINVAERLGLIQEIDKFILKSAIKKQADLLREGHDITLAINLSGKAFDDLDLAQKIDQLIIENNARAENLIFEITETSAVSDITSAGKIMTQIQALGCQFALDDFGVGFSSFYYLRELPVEYVKIDGSFIKDLPNNTDNQVLVKALSEVAIGFNKLSVAEFVDSLETLHILNEAKVNFAQGYFIGKPSEKIPIEPPNFHQAALTENTAFL